MKTRIKNSQLLHSAMFLLFLLTARQEVIATSVSGTIVNGNWTSNNSPYVVVGNINVAGLTIGPGVTVSFASNYSFEIDGVLAAIGTPNAPIVFMGTNAGWQGIYFNIGGPGSVLANCIISNSINSGIHILNTTPLIENCVVSENSSASGGGIYINNINAGGTTILLNSQIINNTSAGTGGAIAANVGTNLLEIDGCVISNNIANPSVSVETCWGGGVAITGNLLLKYSKICNNACNAGTAFSNDQSAEGGGIFSQEGSDTILNCEIINNSAYCAAGGHDYAFGGGIEIGSGGTIWATNSIIGQNTALAASSFWGTTYNGGGISMGGTGGAVVNCTFAYNSPEGLNSGIASFPVINSVFYFDNGGTTEIIGTTNVTYCDVENGFTGTGNITRNPIFLSTTDLIIVPGSPCIGAGSTNAIYNNLYFPPSLGVGGNDMGAHGGPGAGASLGIAVWPPAEVFFYGGVPGYDYLIQASTDLVNWQTVEPVQIANVGDIATYSEPDTNNLPHRFYKLNLAP
jgi:hypothetical protein